MKYRKRPITVEAVKVSEALKASCTNWKDLPVWMQEAYEAGVVFFGNRSITIRTLEGTIEANYDDWVIQGIKDELYPCKPDVFAESYDPLP